MLDLVRHVPAHRLEQRDSGDRDAHGLPLADHQLEHRDALGPAESAFEVGAERVAQPHRGLLRTSGLRRGDGRVHRGDLLGLAAVVVAPGERVAHLDIGARQPALAAHIELRVEAVGPVVAGLVEHRRGVADAGTGHEALGDLVDAGHLRRPLRVGERADRDHFRAGLAERVEQPELGLDGNRRALDLQAFAHRVVGDDDRGRQQAVGGFSGHGSQAGRLEGFTQGVVSTIAGQPPSCQATRRPLA